MIKAAGVMFVTKAGATLMLKRGPSGDHPSEWCVPGGQIEDGETAEQAAIRETKEETGYTVKAEDLVLHTRNISNAEIGAPDAAMPAGAGASLQVEPALAVAADLPPAPPGDAVVVPGVQVDFTTFLCRVDEPFPVTICEESVGYAWTSVLGPPEPLHPGVRIALARLSMNELGVARAMAAGDLTSPQVYENVTLWAIRITGTGQSYRPSIDEHVHRDKSLYLNDEMLARCNGLPVIAKHPEGALLNSEEFGDRIVGTIFLPYIQDDEVWGIAKIYDDWANGILRKRDASTSPGVLVGGTKLTGEGGAKILIERSPKLMDHIAILPSDKDGEGGEGVWDKGGELSGVDQSGVDALAMADSAEIVIAPSRKLADLAHRLTITRIQVDNAARRRA